MAAQQMRFGSQAAHRAQTRYEIDKLVSIERFCAAVSLALQGITAVELKYLNSVHGLFTGGGRACLILISRLRIDGALSN